MTYNASNMILIYTHEITNRINYTFHLLFERIMGIKYECTKDTEQFANFEGPKFCYSNKDLFAEYKFWPVHELLFEQGIKKQDTSNRADQTILSLDDPFASTFYVASRYEEYLPHTSDIFKRFEANQSILFHKNLLHYPVIHVWAEKILATLSKSHPIQGNKKQFDPIVLIDVDQAFSYKHKGTFWSAYIAMKNFLKSNREDISLQSKVLRGKMADPYDSFDYLMQVQALTGLKMIYFIHAGSRSKYDRPIPLRFKGITQLVKNISNYAEVGLHPSFQSNDNEWMIRNEKELLERIISKPVKLSRQHYLRLSMPVTYRRLIDHGITEDFSMGYATEPGFRAGCCIPFNWFDVQANKATSLVIHPVTFMEGIFAQEKNLLPQHAVSEIEQYIDTVDQYGGQFIAAWHNHTITDQGNWKGWKEVFELMVEKIKAH